VKPLKERFDEKWTPEPFSGCWLWTGSIRGGGYGDIWDGNRYTYAHRVSWELHKGKIPYGLFVLHKCDTKSCVNPDHLFLGTLSDNMLDAISKGRRHASRGASNESSKLTNEDIRYIRNSLDLQKHLAKKFKVSQPTISYIKNHKTYKETL